MVEGIPKQEGNLEERIIVDEMSSVLKRKLNSEERDFLREIGEKLFDGLEFLLDRVHNRIYGCEGKNPHHKIKVGYAIYPTKTFVYIEPVNDEGEIINIRFKKEMLHGVDNLIASPGGIHFIYKGKEVALHYQTAERELKELKASLDPETVARYKL